MKRRKAQIYVFIVSLVIYQVFWNLLPQGMTMSKVHADSVSEKPETTIMKASGEVEYPELTDEQICNMTYLDRVARYQIPEKALTKLSTEELFDAVMDYPLIVDLTFYDTPEEGVNLVKSVFNGMNELLNREDIIEVAIRRYQRTDIPSEANADYDAMEIGEDPDAGIKQFLRTEENRISVEKDTRIRMENLLLETILASDRSYEKMTKEEKDVVMQEAVEKSEQQKNSEIYGHRAEGTFLDCALRDQNKTKWEKYMNQRYQVDIKDTSIRLKQKSISKKKKGMFEKGSQSTTYLRTPKGSAVVCTINNDTPNIWSDQVGFISSYPNFSLISAGYRGGNCHGYAWGYRTDIYLEDYNAGIFIDDGSYKKRTYVKNVISGDHVVWEQFRHSGIVTGRDSTGEIFVKSKWGPEGVFEGPVSQTPGYGSIRGYYKHASVC